MALTGDHAVGDSSHLQDHNTIDALLATAAHLNAATQTFTGQIVVQRPAAESDPLLAITDETHDNRFTFAILPSAATQFHIYGGVNEPAILGLIGPDGNAYADFTYDGANADIDVSAGDLNLRPLQASHNVNVWSLTAGTTKLRVGSHNFAQSLDLWHDGTNAHLNSSTGYVGFASNAFQILSTGAVNYAGPSTTSATAGGNGSVPAQVGGYLSWQVGGTAVRIPYFLA